MPDALKIYLAYRVMNLVNGKCYIGITGRTLAARWSEHLSAAARGRRGFLYAAIRKYGATSFACEELAYAGERSAIQATERLLVEQWHARPPGGYNLSPGGEIRIGPRRRLSEEHKRHISVAQKGRRVRPEELQRRAEGWKRLRDSGWKDPRRGKKRRTGWGAHRANLAGTGPLKFAGVEYATAKDAARAAGVTPACMAKWVHRYGLEIPERPGRRVRVGEAFYANRAAAASACGVTVWTVRRWLRSGRAAYVFGSARRRAVHA